MENHEGYANQAFRAEIHEASPVAKKFDNLKNHFDTIRSAGPINDANKDKVGEDVKDFFDTFSRGYKSVEQMENIVSDASKTEKQKQFAMDDLDLLGKVVYEGVREDENFARFIGEGSASGIDENLPDEFKGIGKVVLTNVFEEGPVLDALRNLDSEKELLRRMPDDEEKNEQIKEMVKETIGDLRKLKDLTPGQNLDREMSLGYLGYEIKGIRENVRTGTEKEGDHNDGEVDKIVKAIHDLKDEIAGTPEEKAEARVKTEKEKIREELDFYQMLLRNPTAEGATALSPLSPDFQKKGDKITVQKTIDLVKSAAEKASLPGLKEFASGMGGFHANNEAMDKLIYGIEGVDKTAEYILQTYFHEPTKKEPSGTFTLVLNDEKIDGKKYFDDHSEAKDKGDFENLDKVFDDVAQVLYPNKTELNDREKIAVTRALGVTLRLFAAGDLFEDADRNKTFLYSGLASPHIWFMSHMGERSRAKNQDKGEIYGGNLGAWLGNRWKGNTEEDKQFREAWKRGEVELLREETSDHKPVVHPVPERLFDSYFTETKVIVEGEDKESISMLEALYRGKKIDFAKMGYSNDKWNKHDDLKRDGLVLYSICKGDVPLNLAKPDQVTDWGYQLSKGVVDVLGDGQLVNPYIKTREFVKWAIAASVPGGLYAGSAKLIINQEVGRVQQGDMLFSLLNSGGLRQLLPEEKDREWILKEFNCEHGGTKYGMLQKNDDTRKRKKIVGMP